MLVTHAVAQAPMPERIGTDGFYWPMGKEPSTNNWLYHDCTQTYSLPLRVHYYLTDSYHIGSDITQLIGSTKKVTVEDAVYAIADGVVDKITTGQWGKTNVGVSVIHSLESGVNFYAVYGHIHLDNPALKSGDLLTAGMRFATIGPYDPPHLHFGIAPDSLPANNLGMMPCSALKPDDKIINTNGFTDAISWITTHKPKNRNSSVAEPAPAPIALPASAIVIEDNPPQFIQGGTSGFWHTAANGYEKSTFRWTYNNIATQDNVGKWTLNVPQAGSYEVTVFIPNSHASTANAVYEVKYAGGTTRVSINQHEHQGEWESLGTFTFAGNSDEYVRLSDATGEPDHSTEVAFDAVRLVPANSIIAGDPLSWLSARFDELKKSAGNWLKDLESLPKSFVDWINNQKDSAQKNAEQWMQKQLEALMQEIVRQIEDSLKKMCLGNAAIVVVLPALSLWLLRRRNSK